jgi:5-methyltetrahydropteroyltriglutamate--homocysteine methyltransferase
MIRAANHSSYPRLGDNPLDQEIRTVLKARERGEATDEEVARVEDEVTTVIVAEQSRAFIDIVTDGMVRWEGPYSHLARHLDGLQAHELRRWFDTNFYDRRLAVVGEIRHRQPFLVRDWELARAVSQKRPVKVVLPGPVTVARQVRDEHYGDRAAVAEALSRALAAEVGALAAAGADCIQLDEPLLCRHPEDLELVRRCAEQVFAAAPGATTIVSTYFGDLLPLAAQLDRLPGTHVGLDLVSSPRSWELLARLPDGKGVALGLFDARSTLAEEPEELAQRLAPHRDRLTERDVLVGPNAGLELLPRDQAFEKLQHARYLVEKLSQEWTWPS